MSQTEGPNMGGQEAKRSLNERETVDLLLSKGFKRLEVFDPHKKIYYVFEDRVRGDEGPFRFDLIDQRPNMAVVHKPKALDFNSPKIRNADKLVIYKLNNEDGSEIDLCVIDPATHKLTLRPVTDPYRIFDVRKHLLFEAPDGFTLPLNF